MVDRVIQAQYHAENTQKIMVNHSIQQYFDSKLSSSLQSPALNNNRISLSPIISSRSRSHIIKPTTNNGNILRKKAIIMLSIVAILYFISFSPIQVNFIYTQISGSHHLFEHRLFFIITIVSALSSTAFNPVLFYIFSKFFRYKFNIFLSPIFSLFCPTSMHRNDVPMI